MHRLILTVLGILSAAPAALGATAVSAPDTLDSRPPLAAFLFPAGGESLHYAAVETLRWTLDEQSWGGAPAEIVLTELVDGSTPVVHAVMPDADGVYAFAWQVPPLSVHGDLEARFSLRATDRFGWTRTAFSDWFFVLDDVSDVPAAALRNSLQPAAPNPFNPHTTIGYSLAAPARCRLAVFDVRGREVACLVAGDRAAGSHQAVWAGQADDGRNLPSGVYFARLQIYGPGPGTAFTNRLTLVK